MISTRGLTKPEPGHKIYPYLLRELAIERPNQVWAMDIPYIPRCTTSSLSGGGARFTGADFIEVLAGYGTTISMDGKGAWRENVFVERLWRSVKYKQVYLHAFDSVSKARAPIGRYFYNRRRPHAP
jgi:putative transposase